MFASLLAALALAAPVPKGHPALYYPTTTGTKWVYEVDGRDAFTLVVTEVTKSGDRYLVTVAVELATGRTAPFHTMDVSDAGLALTTEQGEAYTPPWRILRLPHRPGEKWAAEATRRPHAGPEFTLRGAMTDRGEEEVRVPAGAFKAVRVVCAESTGERPDGTTTRWFAPGVGCVKMAWSGKVQVLKSFTPGKD